MTTKARTSKQVQDANFGGSKPLKAPPAKPLDPKKIQDAHMATPKKKDK